MLYTCPHCGVGLEYSPQDPVTAVLHVLACKQTAPSAENLISTQISITNADGEDHYHERRAASSSERLLSSKVSIAKPGGEVLDYDVQDDPKMTAKMNARMCPVCKEPVVGSFGLSYYERPNHFNSCWADLVAATVRHETQATDAPQKSEPTLPPPTPNLTKSMPAPAANPKVPESSCVTCARDLSTCSDMDALHHRAMCFAAQSNKSCPICESELSAAEGFLAGSLLHLQRCQRGTQDSYSFIESDDFEALYMSLCGRTELTDRVVKRIEGVSRKGSMRFRVKIERKRNHPDFLYGCGESALRNCVNVDGEEEEGWRTAGDVGKSARNVFPVVKEDFDPFIVMEGSQTHSLCPPAQPINSTRSTSDILSETAVQLPASMQSEPTTDSIDACPPHALPETTPMSGPEAQINTQIYSVYTIPMPVADLPQVEKCIFCPEDPLGNHKRSDKLTIDHTNDDSTCLRCRANDHSVAEATSTTEAHALPRIILTTPDSKHSSVLESFTPNKKALYSAPKRRGRANWIGYKWMPNVKALKTEKATQTKKARNRTLRRERQSYGGVQLLAMGALASTPVSFFPKDSKKAAQPVVDTDGSSAPKAESESSSDPAGSLSSFNMAWSNAIASQGQEILPSNQPLPDLAQEGDRNKEDNKNKDSKSQKSGLGPLVKGVTSQMRGYGRRKKEARNDPKAQETVPSVVQIEDLPKSLDQRLSRMLEKLHVGKPSPEGVQGSEIPHKVQANSPPVSFSSIVTRPRLRITFGTACARASRSMPPLGEASHLDLANGSASHRPFLSPSVHTLSFTIPSELSDVEDPSSPFSRPPSPAWSEISSTSTDSSCLPEDDIVEGWDALALEYAGSCGGIGI